MYLAALIGMAMVLVAVLDVLQGGLRGENVALGLVGVVLTLPVVRADYLD